MRSRNLSRRSSSTKQKRRSFFSWLSPKRSEPFSDRALHFESLEDRRVLATFSNSDFIVIPDSGVAAPFPSTISVGGAIQSAAVLDANLSINDFTHSFPDDVGMMIAGPSGANLVVFNRAGSGADVVNSNITFDDEAGTGIPDPPVTGTYRPDGGSLSFNAPAPASSGAADFTTFDGTNVVGNWNFWVQDFASQDVGSINGWSLTFQLGGNVVINAGAAANNGGADTFEVQVVGGNIQVQVNGSTVFDEPVAGVTSLTINGSNDADTLFIHPTTVPVTFSGGSGQDTLNLVAGGVNGTLNVDGIGIGTWQYTGSGVVDYSGLERLETDGTITVAPIVNGTAASEFLKLGRVGPGGVDLRISESGNTWLLIPFSQVGNITVHGNGGNDRLEVDHGNNLILNRLITYNGGTGSDSLLMNGILSGASNGVYNPGAPDPEGFSGQVVHTDAGANVSTVNFTGLSPVEDLTVLASYTINAFAGADVINAIDGPLSTGADPVTGNLELTYEVNYNGAAELVRFRNKTTVTLNAGGGADTISSSISNRVDAASTNPFTTFNINGQSSPDEIRITAQPAGLTYNVDTDGGVPDRIVIGVGSFAAFNTGTGSLAGILGAINVDDSGGVGSTYIDNSGDATNGRAFNFNDSAAIPTFGVPGIQITNNFNAAVIHVAHRASDIFQFADGSGSSTLNVNATADGGNADSTFFGNAGDDVFNILASGLRDNNTFNGGNGADRFNVNVPLGQDITANSLQINGDATAAARRDQVVITHANARNFTFNYGAGPGEMDVTGFTTTINIDTAETVHLVGSGQDNVTVNGLTGVDDNLTVNPFDTNQILVFRGGSPYDGSVRATHFSQTQLPGIAGGSTSPDLRLSFINQDGFVIDGRGGDGAGATDDRLFAYYSSDQALISTAEQAAGENSLGFGPGILMPTFILPQNAVDDIEVFTGGPAITAVRAGSTTLVDVNVVVASFVQPDIGQSGPLDDNPGVIVNSGHEAVPTVIDPDCDGLRSDSVSVNIAVPFALSVNGGDPLFNPAAPRQGDELNIETSLTSINVFSDKQTPPNVTFQFNPSAGTTFDFQFSGFECLDPLDVTEVNLVGDNNDPAVDQTDNFVVRGQDVDGDLDGTNEFILRINGSPLIPFTNVEFLNAYGFDVRTAPVPTDIPATASTADDIDTLDIRAAADNADNSGPNGGHAPRGWGIDVYYNEGSPNQTDGAQQDLLIYHTSTGGGGGGSVSENIVVLPSGPDNGEVRATNASDGSLVVVISYVANTDLIFVDDDGSLSDTDSLTLRGTNPSDSPNTSGDETVTANFTAAGDVANPLVTVADGASILYRMRNFTGFGGINFELLDGNDSMTLNSGTVQVNVDAGRGNDTINASASTAAVTLRGGEGDDTLTGGSGNDRLEGGSGNDIFVGLAGNDTEIGGDGNDRFGDPAVRDPAANDAGTDFFDGGAGSDTFFWDPGDGDDQIEGGAGDSDQLFFSGNAGGEQFFLFADTTTPSRLHLFRVQAAIDIDAADLEEVNLTTLGGADTVTIGRSDLGVLSDLSTTTVRNVDVSLGTDGAADSVIVEGRPADDNLVVSLSNGIIKTAGLPYDVRLDGAEVSLDRLTINANEGNDTVVAAVGVEAAIGITLNGGVGGDFLSADGIINGNEGNDTLVGGLGNNTMDGGAGDDTFIGNGGTDAIGGGASSSVGDTILVGGTAGNDTISLALDASGFLVATVNGLATTYTNFLSGPIATSGIEQILVEGLAGNDALTVDSTNGAISIPINFDGGSDADALTLTGGTATSDIYSPGPNPGQGTSTIVIGGVTQVVTFTNLEPVIDLVAGPLVVNATNADNAINYSVGRNNTNTADDTTRGRVSVDAFETIDFSNKTTLTVNALAGSDTVNLNNPNTPTGLTGITVNGGDPTADSDTVIVNGSSALDTIVADQFDTDGARIVGAQPVTVIVDTTEHLSINGLGGNDHLTVITPAGLQLVALEDADPTADSGTIQMRDSGADRVALLPVSFRGLGGDGVSTGLTFADISGTRVDEMSITPRTHGNVGDQFTVSAAGTVLLADIAASLPNLQLPIIDLPGVLDLNLVGLADDDVFNIPGNHPFNTIFVDGGEPSASDVLNFTSSGGPVTVDAENGTITETNPVELAGIEFVSLNASGQNVTVRGTLGNDAGVYAATGANSGRITELIINTTLDMLNVGALTIDGNGSDDRLTVKGTTAADVFTISGGAVLIAGLQGVDTLSNVDALAIAGTEGSDTFDVTPSATIPIFVDGGDPIGNGATPADTIVLHPAGPFSVEPGPESDEGGLFNPPNQRVSWDHIEGVTVIGGPGVGPGIVMGTNGDDDITIIARDSSTHALTDGVQDFTVSVNDGVDVLYINVPVLLVDALAGDDDIVVREPAPNNAVWNVQIFVAGGTPASPTGDQGDVVELETPGTQTVVFTPNPAAIPVPALPAGITLTPIVGGIDTAILSDTTNSSSIAIAPFTLSLASPPFPAAFTYTSSPGGAEQIIYQGLAGGDNLTINGTSSDDTTTVNPTGAGSGSFRSGRSPAFDFTGATAVTVNPGTAGFDVLNIDGSAGVDTVTSTATTVSFAGAGSVTIGAGIDRMRLSTYDSNDSVVLSLGVVGLDKIVDAGNGNDTVNMSGVTTDATIFGGDGDDNLVGSPTADFIDGGRGNDTISGLGGDDTIYAGDGNDSITGGTGADLIFGGEGTDTITWSVGDGADTNVGGGGTDTFLINGTAGVETVRVSTDRSSDFGLASAAINGTNNGIDEIELVDIRLGGGADAVIVDDLATTDVRDVMVNNFGGTDGAIDTTTVNGTSQNENFSIAQQIDQNGNSQGDNLFTPWGRVTVFGNSGNRGEGDLIVLNSGAGNDSIVAAAGSEISSLLQLNGQEGDDTIILGTTVAPASGNDTINGGTGNDFLQGGAGADFINGGEGNDTIRGGAGADQMSGEAGDDTFLLDYDGVVDNYFGGDGYDTLVIAGTPGNDVLTVNQSDVGITLLTTLNGFAEPNFLQGVAGVRTLERVRIEAGSGDDTVVVTHADAAGVDGLVNSVLFDIDGGPANTRDRLSVQDNGTGDLVLYRQGTSSDSGSITVGPGNVEPLDTVFTGFERVDPIAATGGAIKFFKLDSLEWNDNIANATHLGADETINVDPNIDPGLVSVPGFADLPADNDFFRIVAEKTGTLDIQVYFSQLLTVPSGRPALPNAGNLDVELYDVDGTLIVDGVLGGLDFGLNDATDNERIRIPAVAGQTYYLRVLPNGTAINTYSITTINTAAPVPFDIELLDTPLNTATNSTTGAPGATAVGVSSDTGRSRFDDITYDNDPTILIRVPNVIQIGGLSFIDDIPANGNPGAPGSPPDETILIPFVTSPLTNAPSAGFRVAVFVTENNTTDPVLAGYAQPIAGRPGVFTFTFANDALAPDGSYFISSSVEIIDPTSPEQNQGFGDLAESLEAVIDTILPPASFGSPGVANDGLILSDDCPTPLINLTNVARPTFWGRAEADTVINLYLDFNNNGTFELATDIFLGQTVATPFDGGDQYPNGYWEIESRLSLNDPSLIPPLPFDGPRTLFITAEDVAGNITGTPSTVATTLQIVIDTQGPQVTDVDINTAGNSYDLFDPKPSTNGPTPLVNSLVISFQDLPARITGTIYAALEEGTIVPGNFVLVGDYNGIIPIQDIILNNPLPAAGDVATATVELVFRTPGPDGIFNTTDDVGKPLPDDRFTLTVRDSITDPLCNHLNGESNASEPQEEPTFPSGDANNGGDFVARFTIDSRAEVGTWGAGAAWIDTNGNTTFDQDNADYTNRDITYYMGYTSDNLFAGNFVRAAGGVADGFDKLAAYGRVGTQWRVLVDVNNDGVITPGVDVAQVQPGASGINGVPVAGNFDGNAANGDEFGVFTGTSWVFDVNHDWILDPGSTLAWTQNGYPVVGNYDGVAGDDLATYRDNTFFIDFGRNGTIDRTFRFGFPTPNNRPVSADVDRDGHDDLGLFVPNRAGVSPQEDAEWYILVSGGERLVNRIHADPIDGVPVIDYKPVPFGNDIYIQYGDEFGLPILANFDPPVTPGGSTSASFPRNNPNNPLDVNNDGTVSPIDALLVVNEINTNGSHAIDTSGFQGAPFIDVDRDNVVSPHDVLLVINKLNEPVSSPSGEGEGEAEASDAFFSDLGAAAAPSAADNAGGLLSLLADDQLRAKRSRAAE